MHAPPSDRPVYYPTTHMHHGMRMRHGTCICMALSTIRRRICTMACIRVIPYAYASPCLLSHDLRTVEVHHPTGWSSSPSVHPPTGQPVHPSVHPFSRQSVNQSVDDPPPSEDGPSVLRSISSFEPPLSHDGAANQSISQSMILLHPRTVHQSFGPSVHLSLLYPMTVPPISQSVSR